MGFDSIDDLEKLGNKLALLQQPEPPKNIKKTVEFGALLWDLLRARPDIDLLPPCHQNVFHACD